MKHIEPLTDFLHEAGAKNVRLAHGGKHPRLVYEWQGRERFFVVSKSPSDPRSMKNALADLRRMLGPIGKPAPEPRRIEQPAYQPRPPLTGWGDPPPTPQPMQTAMLTIIDAVPPGGFAPPPPAPPTGDKDMNMDQLRAASRADAEAAGVKPHLQPEPPREILRPDKHDSRLTPNSVPRNHVKVPYAEVLPLLDRAVEVTATDRQQVLHTIGYSSSVLHDWASSGVVTLRTKYMLLGLLSTLEVPPPQAAPPLPSPLATINVPVNPFTFDETTALFGVLNGFPVEAGVRRGLIGKLAQELARAPIAA